MRQFFLRLPLAAKCAVTVAALCFACSAILVLTASRANAMLLQQFAELFAQQWTEQLALQSRSALLKNDRISLQALLQRHIDNPLISYGAIIDPEGNTLVEAGDRSSVQPFFSTEIVMGKESAGVARVQIDGDIVHNEVSLLTWQLFLLGAVLTGLVAALAYTGSSRLENWLLDARNRLLKPLTEDGPNPYPGADALGRLLDTIHSPPALQLDTVSRREEWVILQIHWQSYGRLSQQWGQAELDQQLANSYQRAALLARLYQGELSIHQVDGLTLRFAEHSGAEAPLFRALCCAQLLQQLDRQLQAQCRIGLLRKTGNPWQLRAAECALSASLHALPNRADGIQLQLPSESKNELQQWAQLEDNRVTQIAERYQQLLEKQLARLQQASY